MSTIPRFTLSQYDRMIEAGIFDPRKPERIELIHGELREMSPIGDAHRDAVNALLNGWVRKRTLPDHVVVQVQNPIRLPDQQSAPQPDMSWIAARTHTDGAADEVYLVIEVADSTLEYDRGEKASLYAEAAIPDYWIVNLVDCRVEVRRNPCHGDYQSLKIIEAEGEVRPLLFPSCSLPASLLF
jgi:Uma2 family endonuclease